MALVDAGLSFGEVVNVFGERQSDEEKTIAVQARDQWTDEGQVEVDRNAIVSEGDDAGAYVMAWVWVSLPDEEDKE